MKKLFRILHPFETIIIFLKRGMQREKSPRLDNLYLSIQHIYIYVHIYIY